MLVDQKTEGVVVPLNLALDCKGRLELANSSLSEVAVLGVRLRYRQLIFVISLTLFSGSSSTA